MFLGRHYLAFDIENRLTVPSWYHEPLSMGGIITRGFDSNLWVLPDLTFQKVCLRLREMNLADPLARLLLRMVLGYAYELQMDQSGSIMVPQNLQEYANLINKVVVIGQGDYFEIWDPVLWKKQEAQLSDAESNKERFARLTIATSAP